MATRRRVGAACTSHGGAVSVAGKLDAAFGGPPTQRPAVVVEVKGGMWRDEHRADAHLYGLLVALRDGRGAARRRDRVRGRRSHATSS